MKCEDCLQVIEEYFDAELDVKAAEQVAAHIAGCAECSDVYESLRQEQTIYASYRRNLDVTPALWTGIQARIHGEAPAVKVEKDTVRQSSLLMGLRGLFTSLLHVPRFSPALAAALVVFAVGATVVVMSYLQSRTQPSLLAQNPSKDALDDKAGEVRNLPSSTQENGGMLANNSPGVKEEINKDNVEVKPVKAPIGRPRSVEAVNKPRQSDSLSTADQLLRDAERKYVAAIAILNRDYDKRRSQLNAETIARFDAALDSIDRTIAATKAAVNKNPDDPIALQYMLAAYAKKVEVLKDITRGS